VRDPVILPLGRAEERGGGQQEDIVTRTLYKDLPDCGRSTEVAVKLKRQIYIEHVRVGALRTSRKLRMPCARSPLSNQPKD
jgi:hypothetical protein